MREIQEFLENLYIGVLEVEIRINAHITISFWSSDNSYLSWNFKKPTDLSEEKIRKEVEKIIKKCNIKEKKYKLKP